MSCRRCDADKVHCIGLCNSCYQKQWKKNKELKVGKIERIKYSAIDNTAFWLWLRDEVKLAEAQTKPRTAKSEA